MHLKKKMHMDTKEIILSGWDTCNDSSTVSKKKLGIKTWSFSVSHAQFNSGSHQKKDMRANFAASVNVGYLTQLICLKMTSFVAQIANLREKLAEVVFEYLVTGQNFF